MSEMLPVANTALLVVDVQRAFDEWSEQGQRRNSPGAEANIAALLEEFREKGAPIIHIRHASLRPESRFRAELPGHEVKEEAREVPGEPVLVKSVNSAFIGTDLEERLRSQGIEHLVIVGATTNHCVETTTRMAGNLGFDAVLVEDATWTYDRVGLDGQVIPAETIQRVSMANLNGEFAEIATTEDVIARLG